MNKSCSILLGNPLVNFEGDTLVHKPQDQALRYGLEFATKKGGNISLNLLFDHIGRFDPFLKKGLSRKDKKRIRVSTLHPDILSYYAPILKEYGFDPSTVRVITEAQCRLAILNLSRLETPQQANIIRRCLGECGRSKPNTSSINPRVNCSAIVAATIQRLAQNASEIICFWEEEERVPIETIIEGTHYAREYLDTNIIPEHHFV